MEKTRKSHNAGEILWYQDNRSELHNARDKLLQLSKCK